MGRRAHLGLGIGIAALLWFYMFSPWTSGLSNFWMNMSIAAVVLSVIAITGNGGPGLKTDHILEQLVLGIAIAVFLWGVFWVGDKLSQMMFSFARGQVDSVYGMKAGLPPSVITFLLLFLIGPAEEYFWRGYVQRNMSGKIGATAAMFVTAIIYAAVHIWSFNFMLVMAALVAGGVWGLIYRIRPSLLPALIVSHAVWDALVFVILPI